jgi:hypothetical protein
MDNLVVIITADAFSEHAAVAIHKTTPQAIMEIIKGVLVTLQICGQQQHRL